MKRYLSIILIIVCFASCAKDETDNNCGNIYGVVTVKATAEPMRATGVELYLYGSLILKTVTYDDGHYEFENLKAGEYELRVVATGYTDVSYKVHVEAGRTARADMQLENVDTHMTVRTLDAIVTNHKVSLYGKYDSRKAGNYTTTVAHEVGFSYSTSLENIANGTIITASFANHASYGNNAGGIYGSGAFETYINNLSAGTWYIQAYAKNNYGTEYGEIKVFEISGQPSVTTLKATNVTGTTATLNGRIDDEGDPKYTERGFVYSSSFTNPTVDDPTTATTKVIVSGTSKEFSANIAGLTEDASYYVRAYVSNSKETVYGKSVSFIATSYVPYVIIDAMAVQKTDLSTGTNLKAAIDLCKQSRVGGFEDWHVPTLSELTLLYTNQSSVEGLSQGSYWSNTFSHTNVTGNYYYAIDFQTGQTFTPREDANYRVRCVRTVN